MVFPTVTPILVPVKEPGPFTTYISLISFVVKLFSFNISSIYGTKYEELCEDAL